MKTLLIVAGTALAGIGSAVLFAPFAAGRRRPPRQAANRWSY